MKTARMLLKPQQTQVLESFLTNSKMDALELLSPFEK